MVFNKRAMVSSMVFNKRAMVSSMVFNKRAMVSWYLTKGLWYQAWYLTKGLWYQAGKCRVDLMNKIFSKDFKKIRWRVYEYIAKSIALLGTIIYELSKEKV